MKIFFCVLILMLSAGVISAQEMAMELRNQLKSYHSVAPQEKIFVHTDKSFYLAGETIWFKIYSVDASFHKPCVSRIAYIEILNQAMKPVLQTKIALSSGNGNGSLVLPGFLTTGNYMFRAYTNWMKNFPADYYYEQTIEIVNTLKTSLPAPSPRQVASIQFFPEGGNLVTGLQGKIGFKALDSTGKGLNCQGIIVNNRNDTITKFQSLIHGMGSFSLLPEKNTSYYAVVRMADSLYKEKLPAVADQGFVMHIDQSTSEIKVNILATPGQNNLNVFLLTHTREQVKNVQTALIKDDAAFFTIDPKELGDGLSSITLFTSNRQPVCERLVFKRPKDSILLQIKSDFREYATRKPVNIDLTATNHSGAVQGNFSMSVFLTDSLQSVPVENIVSYLFLGSDLKGNIEDPEFYFRSTELASKEALENLLLTQGWRRFKWDDVLASQKPSFEFLPELEGPVVNAKMINKVTGAVVPQSIAYLSIPGADYAFSSATSNHEGTIHFGFRDIYKNNVVVVQPALAKDSNYRVDISNSWSEKFSTSFLSSLSVSKNVQTSLLNRSVGNQVENTYNVEKKRRYSTAFTDTSAFYGNADKIYNLDDFTRFQTMEEVLREYVEDVRVRKEGERFTFKVRNRLFGTYFDESPLILLDGVSVSDASTIIALDPLKVKKVEVVTHRYYIGSSVFDGIVNVKSYSGELVTSQIDPNALVVEYEGIQQQREFYSPVYNENPSASHIPDFRNLLSWSPQIKTGSDGKANQHFYTSDIPGHYVVVVQGLSGEGLPAYALSYFDVSDSK